VELSFVVVRYRALIEDTKLDGRLRLAAVRPRDQYAAEMRDDVDADVVRVVDLRRSELSEADELAVDLVGSDHRVISIGVRA
jgi:hypothetical protein